jgi:hypothetical protein
MKTMTTSRRAALLAVAIVGCGSLATGQCAQANSYENPGRQNNGSLSYGGRQGQSQSQSQGQQIYRSYEGYGDRNRDGGGNNSHDTGTDYGNLRNDGNDQSRPAYSNSHHSDANRHGDGGYRSHDQAGDGGHNHDGYDGRDGGRADQHHDGDHSSESSSGTKKLVIGVVIGAILGAVLGH